MYDSGRLFPIFSAILGESKQYSKGEYYFYCPFCSHYNPKLAVNLLKGKWHCWKCNASGHSLLSLLKKLSATKEQIQQLKEILVDELPQYQQDLSVSSTLSLPEEFKPLWKINGEIEQKHALIYLKNRGITVHDIFRYELGYCTSGMYANRIIIPSFDSDGKLNYFVGRDFFESSTLKYKNPPISKNIIGFEYHINWKYPICLCEGVFDAMAIKWNAIPLFGKTVSPILKQKIIENKVSEIFVALDKDASTQATNMSESFLKNGLKVHFIEMNEKDPSKIGFESMRKLITDSNPLTFYDMVSKKL